jgi:hypothetical protein
MIHLTFKNYLNKHLYNKLFFLIINIKKKKKKKKKKYINSKIIKNKE